MPRNNTKESPIYTFKPPLLMLATVPIPLDDFRTVAARTIANIEHFAAVDRNNTEVAAADILKPPSLIWPSPPIPLDYASTIVARKLEYLKSLACMSNKQSELSSSNTPALAVAALPVSLNQIGTIIGAVINNVDNHVTMPSN
jgi:hypothetical protein